MFIKKKKEVIKHIKKVLPKNQEIELGNIIYDYTFGGSVHKVKKKKSTRTSNKKINKKKSNYRK